MPRVNDIILNSAIYLYPSVLDAKQGEKAGGSGFLVGFPTSVEGMEGWYIYAVTNSHVIREGNSPVIRINTKDNAVSILNYGCQEWYHHPDGDDLAVAPINIESRYKYSYIPIDLFINQQIMLDNDIGAGDEVFMVGRFVGYDGKQQNEPTVRFGNLSIGKVILVETERGIKQESFLIETRSLPGYSGSPVFLHILPYSVRQGSMAIPGKYQKDGKKLGVGPWLLGVDYGHHNFYEKVREKNEQEVQEGWVVRTNSGIANVVPAWKLADLLNIHEFVEMRKENDKKLEAEIKQERESDLEKT